MEEIDEKTVELIRSLAESFDQISETAETLREVAEDLEEGEVDQLEAWKTTQSLVSTASARIARVLSEHQQKLTGLHS